MWSTKETVITGAQRGVFCKAVQYEARDPISQYFKPATRNGIYRTV